VTAESLAKRLGGRKALGRTVRSELDLADAIHEGLAIGALEHVLEAEDLEPVEAYALIGSRRTLLRKKQEGRDLSPGESDRLARVVRVIARTEEALGDRERAHRWLRSENRALGGRRPIDLLDSDTGARMVERVLGRLEHGVYS
jgi:putative toxin-antitoxin system antitoxin component (TIGR02293 family)